LRNDDENVVLSDSSVWIIQHMENRIAQNFNLSRHSWSDVDLQRTVAIEHRTDVGAIVENSRLHEVEERRRSPEICLTIRVIERDAIGMRFEQLHRFSGSRTPQPQQRTLICGFVVVASRTYELRTKRLARREQVDRDVNAVSERLQEVEVLLPTGELRNAEQGEPRRRRQLELSGSNRVEHRLEPLSRTLEIEVCSKCLPQRHLAQEISPIRHRCGHRSLRPLADEIWAPTVVTIEELSEVPSPL